MRTTVLTLLLGAVLLILCAWFLGLRQGRRESAAAVEKPCDCPATVVVGAKPETQEWYYDGGVHPKELQPDDRKSSTKPVSD
jgi:hypothetical protein